MTVVILLVVASVVAFALAAYLLRSARRNAVAVGSGSTLFDDADGVVSEPVPIDRVQPHAAEEPPAPKPVARAVPVAEFALDEALVDDSALYTAPAGEPTTDAVPVETPAEAAPDEPAPAAAAPDEPAPADAAPSEPMPEIRWTRRFSRNGALDDQTRLGLIRDLGLVRAAWGVPLLLQAYDEEREPEYRRAVLVALAAYRHLDTRAVFEQAARSDDEHERTIAAGALVDLGVVRTLPS